METGVTGADVSGATTTTTTTISLSVKFSGRTIPITNLSPDSTIKDLKALLQPLTNVLPRGQKLISKGKLLVDAMTLRESEITNGAKIMLMASQGLHQGAGPILKQAQSRPISRDNNADRSDKGKAKKAAVDKNRLERWKATGVIGLSECNLKAIPEEVWGDSRTSARVLDLSNNVIQEVPALIGCMNSLQKLLLDSNDLSDDSVSWEALKSLKSLTVLSLNQNRISTIPTWIGDLITLIEVDLSSNLLSDLPETFSNLHNLKSLSLSNNGLKSLPSSLFKMCLMLTRLDLHNTEITMDILRQIEGWENFDERRRLKQQKKLDFRVVGSAAFDEGADKS